MNLDFCVVSTGLWVGVSISSILSGAVVGYALQALLPKAGFGLSASSLQNFTGGCLLPGIVGLLSGLSVARLIPNDPCGGAFTPDAIFVPLLVIPLVTVGAIALLWAKAWRR